MYINFIAVIVCIMGAVYQIYLKNVGLCLIDIALALLNLPATIRWMKEYFS